MIANPKYEIGSIVNYGEDTVTIIDCQAEYGQWLYSIDYCGEIIKVEEDELNMEGFEQCQWCEEFFDKAEGKTELNMGFLCNRCIGALWSRGEKLYLVEEL